MFNGLIVLKSIIHIERRIQFICNTRNLVNTNYFKMCYVRFIDTHTHTHKHTPHSSMTTFRTQVIIYCDSPLTYSFWYISNKMQHYTVYLFLENCSTCFGWYLHPSSGAHTQLYLQYLVLVKQLLLPAAIVEELGLVWVWCENCIDLFWCGCLQPHQNRSVQCVFNDHTFYTCDCISWIIQWLIILMHGVITKMILVLTRLMIAWEWA